MGIRNLFIVTVLLVFISSCGNPAGRVEQQPAVDTSVQVSSPASNAAEPAVAAGKDGSLYVVWVDHSDEKHPNVMLQRFGADAKPIAAQVKVNPDADAVKSWFGDPPSVAVDRGGAVYVGWNRANKGSRGNDLVLSVSHDGGDTFNESVKVNDDSAPASHGMHSLALDEAGRVYMAWLDERNIKKPERTGGSHHEAAEPNSEVYFSSSSDGGKTFAKNKKLGSEICPCCKTSLLTAKDGRVYVGWRQVLTGDFRHVAVAHSNDQGETFSDGVIVSDDKWQINACPVSGAALTMSDDATLSVVWYTSGEGQAGLYTARSADGGATFSDRRLLSNEAASGTAAMFSAASFVFPAKDGRIDIQDLAGGTSRVLVADAQHPAAVTSGASKYVCYVRKSGEKSSSIWLTRLGS